MQFANFTDILGYHSFFNTIHFTDLLDISKNKAQLRFGTAKTSSAARC